MNGNSAIVAIFREFIGRYPWQFGLLFLLLVAEGAAAALSILALVPLADFLLDPALAAPSRITGFVVQLCAQAGQPPGFWLFGMLFVGLTAIRSLAEVLIRHAVLRIKYSVLGGLVDDNQKKYGFDKVIMQAGGIGYGKKKIARKKNFKRAIRL